MAPKPINFADPHVLGQAMARATSPRAVVEAARAEAAKGVARPAVPIQLERTMHKMVAELASRQRKAVAPITPTIPELIAAQRNPVMTHQIRSLADALRSAQDRLPRAMKAGEKLAASLDDLDGAVTQVETLSSEVQKHTAAVRALLGGVTNGGPALDEPAKTGG